MSVEILGVRVDALSLSEAVDRALSLMAEHRGAFVCTPNPEMIWLGRKNRALVSALNAADLLLADGVGDLMAAGILGDPLPERVTGIDFVCALMERMEGSVFLLGARPGVAERAAREIRKCWPGLCIAGCADGYYSDEDAVVARIRAAGPDLLFVCLGMERQELFMQRLSGCPDIGLMVGLGGTLDILAGDVKRAPDFFLQHNLEWLYRLARQPFRIKRVMRLPLFLAAVIKQKVTQ